MNLALTYNIRHFQPSLKNKKAIEEAEFDTPETIKGISEALKRLGHKVFLIEADKNAYLKFKNLRKSIDLVFNVAEGIEGADREAQIPAMLEMLGIPYVGSKPLTQALCLNKAKTKEVLVSHSIPTPRFQLFKTTREKINKNLRFPVIVKPNSEGSSKGIFQSSIAKNREELKRNVGEIIKKLKQPALAEEFLPGREFTVAVIGNNPAKILPIVEINFSGIPKDFFPIDSYEVKWILDNPDSETETVICPAKISQKLEKIIKEVCLKAKETLDILDWCRIDLRLDKKGVPNLLEINQIPGIIPDPKENSRFPLAARVSGLSYGKMLEEIIKSACVRYNLKTC
ncbi:MAG: ATP-grasp domain-containing protein [bacterium]|nr:ATP-grasp domain-containing protein [bacterium]